MQMNRTQWAYLAIAASVILGLLSLFLDPGAHTANATNFHINTALGIITAVLQLAAATMFLTALDKFKMQLRHAYILICVAIIMLGVSQVQVPISVYFGLIDSFWVKSGLIAIPYLSPTVLLFLGVGHFARLFNIRERWYSFWPWCIGGLFFSVIAGTTLHTLVGHDDKSQFIGTISVTIWAGIMFFVTLLMILKIRRTAALIYQPSLRWLAIGMGTLTIFSLEYVTVTTALGFTNAIQDHGGIVLPQVIIALAFLRAGVMFANINAPEAERHITSYHPEPSILDVVMYAATQVSNPQRIDATLNKLRAITASLEPGEPITPEKQQRLKGIYQEIEHYLIHDEPIRQFDKTVIRENIANHFQVNPAKASFWK